MEPLFVQRNGKVAAALQAYGTKQVEAYAVKDGEDWLVITVIARYF